MIYIGIWYKYYKWGKCVAETILANSNTSTCTRCIQHDNKFHFEFANTVIDIIPAIKGSRGYKFDIIYLQEGIDEDFCHTTIYPTLMHRMFNHSS